MHVYNMHACVQFYHVHAYMYVCVRVCVWERGGGGAGGGVEAGRGRVNFISQPGCKWSVEAARLEVGNNKWATARGSCFIFYFLHFWWYLWEAVGIASHFLSCSHTMSFSDVHNNM